MQWTEKYIRDNWRLLEMKEKDTFVSKLKDAYEFAIDIIDKRKEKKDTSNE